jgi:hypothetical protein
MDLYHVERKRRRTNSFDVGKIGQAIELGSRRYSRFWMPIAQ